MVKYHMTKTLKIAYGWLEIPRLQKSVKKRLDYRENLTDLEQRQGFHRREIPNSKALEFRYMISGILSQMMLDFRLANSLEIVDLMNIWEIPNRTVRFQKWEKSVSGILHQVMSEIL